MFYKKEILEENKKMKQKMWAIVIIVALVGAVMGASAMYMYRQDEVDQAFEQGMEYQQEISPEAVTPASVSMSFSTGSFDHSGTVDSDGAVSAETDVNDTLTISNDDETRTAKNPKLMLSNPVTGTDGLHDNLETDSTVVSVTIGGVTKPLYKDGDYTDGIEVSDLGPGAEAELTVTVTFEDAVDGTYQDGQTYDCNLYIYQPNANYAVPVSFTVST
jgi:hypothetical protein